MSKRKSTKTQWKIAQFLHWPPVVISGTAALGTTWLASILGVVSIFVAIYLVNQMLLCRIEMIAIEVQLRQMNQTCSLKSCEITYLQEFSDVWLKKVV